MDKNMRIEILALFALGLGLMAESFCLPRPTRLFGVLMAAMATKQTEKSLSDHMRELKADEERERAKTYLAVLTILPALQKAREQEERAKLEKIMQNTVPQEGEGLGEFSPVFEVFQKEHPYLPVLFPSNKGGFPPYLGSNLDFSLRCSHRIMIQPDLQKSLIFDSAGREAGNIEKANIPAESRKLFLELSKNSGGGSSSLRA